MSLDSRLERLLAGHAAPLREAVTASRLLLRTAHLLERQIDTVLAPHGLTMRDYLALVLIGDEAHEPLRPSDLSVTLDATRTQITRLLDGLEAKGLAQREPSPADRRSLQLAPTETGTALLATVAPAVRACYQAAWAPLGDAGTQQASARLRRLHDHLDGDGA